jgi:hypothetical protein
MTVMSPIEEIRENDELWEFSKLKTEIYEIVSNMYTVGINADEDEL